MIASEHKIERLFERMVEVNRNRFLDVYNTKFKYKITQEFQLEISRFPINTLSSYLDFDFKNVSSIYNSIENLVYFWHFSDYTSKELESYIRNSQISSNEIKFIEMSSCERFLILCLELDQKEIIFIKDIQENLYFENYLISASKDYNIELKESNVFIQDSSLIFRFYNAEGEVFEANLGKHPENFIDMKQYFNLDTKQIKKICSKNLKKNEHNLLEKKAKNLANFKEIYQDSFKSISFFFKNWNLNIFLLELENDEYILYLINNDISINQELLALNFKPQINANKYGILLFSVEYQKIIFIYNDTKISNSKIRLILGENNDMYQNFKSKNISDLKICEFGIKAYFHNIYLSGNNILFDCLDSFDIIEDFDIKKQIEDQQKNLMKIFKYNSDSNISNTETQSKNDSIDEIYKIHNIKFSDILDKNKLNIDKDLIYSVYDFSSFIESKNLLTFSKKGINDIQSSKNWMKIQSVSNMNMQKNVFLNYNLNDGQLFYWDIPFFKNRFINKFKLIKQSLMNQYYFCGSADNHGNLYNHIFDLNNNVLYSNTFPEKNDDSSKLLISTEILKDSECEIEFLYSEKLKNAKNVLVIFDSNSIFEHEIGTERRLEKNNENNLLSEKKDLQKNNVNFQTSNIMLLLYDIESEKNLILRLDSEINLPAIQIDSDIDQKNLRNEEFNTNPDWKLLLEKGFILAFVKKIKVPIVHPTDHIENIKTPLFLLLNRIQQKLDLPISLVTGRSDIFYSIIYHYPEFNFLKRVLILDCEENFMIEKDVHVLLV